MTTEVTPATVRRRDILDNLWFFFRSPRLAFWLMVVVAALCVLGTLFPQASSQAAPDSIAYAQWWAGVQERFGSWAGPLAALGLFDVYDALWFRLPLAVLLFNLLICTADRLSATWQSVTQAQVRQKESFFAEGEGRVTFTTQLPVEQMLNRLREALRVALYRVRTEEESSVAYLCADRFRWAELGPVVIHLGLVIVAVGAVVSRGYAWREKGVTVAPGQTYQVGHGSDLSLRLDAVQVDRDPDGAPRQVLSHVTLLPGEQPDVIGVNWPVFHRGVAFYQSGYGPAVRVRAFGEGGRSLELQTSTDETAAEPEAILLFPGEGSERYVAVSARGIVVRLTFYESLPEQDVWEPVFVVQGYRGNAVQPFFTTLLQKSGPVNVGGVRIELTLDHYAVWQVVRDPGVPIAIVGLALVVAGVVAVVFFPHTRLWALVAEEKGEVTVKLAAGAGRHVFGFGRGFARLVDELRERV